MGKAKKLMISFIVFFSFVSLAYAQDYSLQSGKFYELKEGEEKIRFEPYNGTYTICEFEKKSIPILFSNKANIDNKYLIEAAGASWIKLSVEEFSLAKKQSGIVFLELRPEQSTNGRHTLRINSLSSAGNVDKEISLDVNVEKCYSIALELEKEEDKVCGGTKNQYAGDVTNEGTRKSDVEVFVDGPEWFQLDKNAFSVAADGKQSFELIADVPAEAQGIFNVFLRAVIKAMPSISSEKNIRLEVVPKYQCYRADVISDAKIKNNYEDSYILIKIRNSGIKPAVYNVDVQGPSWISAEPKTVAVNPEQVGNINLHINPSADIPEDAYPIKINIMFEDVAYTKNVDIVLRRNEFFKKTRALLVFYKYYIYLFLAAAVILLIFRRQIYNKAKTSYKNYKVRRARLRALEKAREARKRKD